MSELLTQSSFSPLMASVCSLLTHLITCVSIRCIEEHKGVSPLVLKHDQEYASKNLSMSQKEISVPTNEIMCNDIITSHSADIICACELARNDQPSNSCLTAARVRTDGFIIICVWNELRFVLLFVFYLAAIT